MLKRLIAGATLLFLSSVCQAQIVNPGGDVYKSRNNTYASNSVNNFGGATLVLPNGTTDPTGQTCSNAAAVYIDSATGKEFSCVSGAWKGIGADFSALSGDVFATTAGAATVQALRGVALSTATPTANQVLQYYNGSWTPQTLFVGGDASGQYNGLTVNKLQGTSLNIQGVTPTDHYALVYDTASGKAIWGLPAASVVALGGDVTGQSNNNTLTSLQGKAISASAPLNGQYFAFNGTQWVPTTLPAYPTSVTMGGDVTGNSGTSTVAKLQGIAVSATVPTANQILAYNGTQWAPSAAPSVSSVTMGGDISGASNTATVAKIQGQPVSATAPTNGQSLAFNGTQYAPTSWGGDVTGAPGSNTVSKLQGLTLAVGTPTTNQVMTYNGTQIVFANSQSAPANYAMGGDVTGTTAASVVSKIEGVAVSATAPTSNQVLAYNGTQWAPAAANQNALKIQGINVSATAPTASQVLSYNSTNLDYEPTTLAAISSVTMGGDVTGNSGTSTVAKIEGVAVSSTAPAANQALIYNGTQWAPTAIPAQNPTLGGDLSGTAGSATVAKLEGYTLSLTGTPTSGQTPIWNGTALVFGNPTASATTVTMGGDVTGASNAATVAKLQGKAVSATAPTGGQMLTWNATNSDWEPTTYAPPANYSMAGDVTGTTAASVLSAIGGIAIAPGAPTTGQALIYNGTKLAYANPQSAANAIELQGYNIKAIAPVGNQALVWNSTNSDYEPTNILTGASSLTLAGDVTGPGSATVVGKLQGKAVSSTAPTANQVLTWNATNSDWEPSAANATQLQGVNINSTAPVSNQVLTYNGTQWSAIAPTHHVSWQISDAVNALTTTSGTAPNLAVNTSSNAWSIQSIYCISDDSATTTYQLTTGGANIGPSGGLSCSNAGATTSTGLTITSVPAGATISQSMVTPSAAIKHMTVVVTYQ